MEFKKQFPWWFKIATKILLSRLPIDYSFWRSIGLFRLGRKDIFTYSTDVIDVHLQRSGIAGQLHGKTILELGPGDSITSAIIAATHGAKAILLDLGSYSRIEVKPYIDLTKELQKKGLHPPDLTGSQDIDEILTRCNAQYLTSGLSSFKIIENESVDLIFSNAVLEHVRKSLFLETMQECRRILKPGGICSHSIDLRDHLGGALNSLRFNDRVWESEFFARSGFYTNRIRYSQMLDLFKQSGFLEEVICVKTWGTMPTPRNVISREYRSMPIVDLLVSEFEVLLYKAL